MESSIMERVKAVIRKHEGYRKFPYRDMAGKLTVGYGRNLDDVGIDKEEAEFLLDRDIVRAYQTLTGVLGKYGIGFDSLPSNVKVALLDMTYNLGGKIASFKKMLTAIKEGNWEEAAKEALDSRWAQQVGKRAWDIALLLKTAEVEEKAGVKDRGVRKNRRTGKRRTGGGKESS